MAEILFALIWLAVGLALWAAVGHLLWKVLAWLFSSLFSLRCVECGKTFMGSECPHCLQAKQAVRAKSDNPDVVDDLAAAKRLIQLARFNQWLDGGQLDSILQQLDAMEQRILGSVQKPTAIPAVAAMSESLTEPPVVVDVAAAGSHAAVTHAAQPHVGSPGHGQTADEAIIASSLVPSQVHPLDQAIPPTSAVGPQSARQPLTVGLLQSFMERSNIRWIELVSASLIVICSVGLVISLWSTLSSTSRFFPSLIFLAATVAVHGAGQYTLRMWKLRSTSRGILHIGLMLIPLAVLVGLLLARREGVLPTLDVSSLAVMGIGTIVYGALAVTASYSLFARRGWLVAGMTTIASLSLLPIHYAVQHKQLDAPWSTLSLLPLALFSALAAIWLSRSSARVAHTSAWMRTVGIINQCLFATGVVYGFWIMQAQRLAEAYPWWWVGPGVISAGWMAWSWSVHRVAPPTAFAAHLPPSTTTTTATTTTTTRPVRGNFLLIAWLVGCIAGLLLCSTLWFTAELRWATVALLAIAGILWQAQGWLCRSRFSSTVGAGGMLLGLAVALEFPSVLEAAGPLQFIDWLGLPRILSMTIVGATAMATALACRAGLSPAGGSQTRRATIIGFSPWTSRRAGMRDACAAVSAAGGLLSGTAALLTVVASLLPVGDTPFGGQWASPLLLSYGILATAGAILMAQRAPANSLAHWIMPLGQGLLLLGVVRLCQSSSLPEDWFGGLEPLRRWSLGVGLLTLGWTWVAAALRSFSATRQQSSIEWLSGLAVPLTLIAALVAWTNPDQLTTATRIGWMLPLTLLGSFRSYRQPLWRELTLVGGACWMTLSIVRVGSEGEWWLPLGLFGSSAVCVGSVVLAVAAIDRLLSVVWETSPAMVVAEEAAEALDKTRDVWNCAWGTAVVCIAGWLAVALSGLLPGWLHGMRCLGVETEAGMLAWQAQGLSNLGFALVLGSLAALSTCSLWRPLQGRSEQWAASMCLLLFVGCMACIAWIEPPYSLIGGMWILAGVVVLGEAALYGLERLAFVRRDGVAKLVESTARACGGLSIAGVMASSVVYAGVALAQALPVEVQPTSGSWWSNMRTLALFLGPVMLVGLSRWSWGLLSSEKPAWPAMAAMSASLFMALAIGLANPARLGDGSYAAADLAVVCGASWAGGLACLAWLTLGLVAARNFAGLRGMSTGRVPIRELLGKALRGKRYARAEQIAWQCILVGWIPVTLLTLSCAVAVISYPLGSIPGLAWLGSGWVIAAITISGLLMWYLSQRRGASLFGLSAIAYGYLAPVASCAYARWLEMNPNFKLAQAEDFEAWRMLLTLWLVLLATGLLLRMRIVRRGGEITVAGEAAWIALATTVGILALIGSWQDPQFVWPFWQLQSLAFITAVSGIVSVQHWRGHIAAVLAAAGMSLWMFAPMTLPPLMAVWNVLWGPLWIALLSLAVRWAWSRGVASDASLSSGVVTVEKTSSLLIPLTSGLLTLVWAIGLNSPLAGFPATWPWGMSGLALAAVVLACGRLWEPVEGKRGLAFYLAMINLSLIAAVCVSCVNSLSVTHSRLLWLTSLLAGMAVMAGLLRELTREASLLGQHLRLQSIADRARYVRALQWMPELHTCVSLAALFPCVHLVMNLQEQSLRVAATVLPLLGATAILPIAVHRQSHAFRYTGLLLTSAALLIFCWAQLPNAWVATIGVDRWFFLQRGFLACIALSLSYLALAYRWPASSQWAGPLVVSSWVGCLAALLSGLLALIIPSLPGHESLRELLSTAPPVTKCLTILGWLAVAVRWLWFAVRPQSVEAGSPDSVRKAAVFVAEIALAGLCFATYFHFPQLFSGLFLAWWPIVLLLLAMLSAGLGEGLRKLNQPILADPVQQSSLLLPIIPLASVWWLVPSQTVWFWNDWGWYALLLLGASALYAMHGWMNGSLGLRALAGMLALFAFWSFLHSNPDLRFFEHPQFWMLPPALAALLFVELNRQRLELGTLTSVRYVALLVAYLSSTSEVFLKAFEGQLWQPLALLVLSLAGIGLGIALRIKAFMLCGTVFTLVALLGMVWHAQQAIGQVWPWFAFGIVTGIILYICLGYFEKNRPRVMAYLQQWKQWEG